MRTKTFWWMLPSWIPAGFLVLAGAGAGAGALCAQTTPLPQWKLAHFTAAQLADGSADDESDPNGDGTPNLLAYAFGLSPFQAAAPTLPAASIAADRLRLSFVRLDPVSDLAYTPEVSTDLKTWSSDTTVFSTEALGGGLSRVVVEDAASVSAAARRFIRLRVVRTVFDSNNDGLLDDWQLKHFASIEATGNAAPLADPDGDGFANIEESAVDTNPSVAAAPDDASALGLTLWTALL